MKKFFTFLLLASILLLACSCRSEPNHNTDDQQITTDNYIIKDMLLETNIDEIKKQFPNAEIVTLQDATFVHVQESMGNIDGHYSYKISEKEITTRNFTFQIPYYKDASTVDATASFPPADNTIFFDETVKELYNSLTKKYKFTNMDFYCAHANGETKSIEDVSSYESFVAAIANLRNGPQSDYNDYKIIGYNSDSTLFFAVTMVNYRWYLEIEVNVQITGIQS